MSALQAAVLGTATASGVFGGAMFAFSSFVMPALRALPPRDALAAMQAINIEAPRSLLMLPLLGTAAGSVALGAHAILAGPSEGRGLRLAGAALGLASFAITAGYHVPRNNALAVVEAGAPEAAGAWTAYAASWTRWNHLRTGAAVASAVLLARSLAPGG